MTIKLHQTIFDQLTRRKPLGEGPSHTYTSRSYASHPEAPDVERAWPPSFRARPYPPPAAPLFTYTATNVMARFVGFEVDRLMELTDDPRLCASQMSSMSFHFHDFNGLSFDHAATHAITRRFLRRVSMEWPYWMHFLAPTPKNYGILLNAMLEPDQVEIKSTSVKSSTMLTPKGQERIALLTNGMVSLHDHLLIPLEHTERMATNISNVIGAITR